MVDAASLAHGDVPRTIVVPLDGSELADQAMALGHVLATRFGAAVQTVTVGPAETAPAADIVLDGRPADALLAHLDRTAPALVCLSSHGRGGVRRRLVGSVADELLRRSPVPVIVRGPRCRPPEGTFPRTILAGVAWSPHLDRLLAILTAWTPLLGADLELVHVRHPSAVELYAARISGHQPPDRPDLEVLTAAVRGHGVRARSQQLTGSDPVDALLAYAERLPPPLLLAVDTHHEDEPAHHDIAYQLLRRAPWPVLATVGR
jgi:nucleotide-binding universal stress UspA family protein